MAGPHMIAERSKCRWAGIKMPICSQASLHRPAAAVLACLTDSAATCCVCSTRKPHNTLSTSHACMHNHAAVCNHIYVCCCLCSLRWMTAQRQCSWEAPLPWQQSQQSWQHPTRAAKEKDQ
jgi:hypothetical protein